MRTVTQKALNRVPFWKMDCLTKDYLLSLAYDHVELERMYESFEKNNLDDTSERNKSEDCVTLVHCQCDFPSSLAEAIDADLNERFGYQVHLMQGFEPRRVFKFVRNTNISRLPRLAGWLWAIVSDPREDFVPIKRYILHRIRINALRQLAFGKFEALPIQ